MNRLTILLLTTLIPALPSLGQYWTLVNNGPCSIQYGFTLYGQMLDPNTANCVDDPGGSYNCCDTLSPYSTRVFDETHAVCAVDGISISINGGATSPIYQFSVYGLTNSITVGCLGFFSVGPPLIDDGGDGPNSLGPSGPIGTTPPLGPKPGPGPAGPLPDDKGDGGDPEQCHASFGLPSFDLPSFDVPGGMPMWHVTEPWVDLWLAD